MSWRRSSVGWSLTPLRQWEFEFRRPALSREVTVPGDGGPSPNLGELEGVNESPVWRSSDANAPRCDADTPRRAEGCRPLRACARGEDALGTRGYRRTPAPPVSRQCWRDDSPPPSFAL